MIQQTIEAAKNQQEGTGIQEEEDLTDIISDIIVNTDAETAAKVIDEVNETETDSNLSLKVISGISEKDSEKLNELSANNKKQMQELTETAVQNAENTSEDSQLIANVVAVVSDEVVNEIMVEVSKISTDEKQSLSAQVLKAIVDTDADKIDIINDDVKETMIEQTIESAKNQQEGTGIQQSQDMTSIVSDIIVNTDTETASKIINEINNTQTETNLSLEIISGITQKDSTKLNILSENNKEQIETLAEKAVENAENTSEDSQLIANIVSVANDELANKVVELTPSGLDKVFFTDSGSETIDTVLKMARGYWRNKGQPSKTKFIGRHKGYHGVNFGGLGVGGAKGGVGGGFGGAGGGVGCVGAFFFPNQPMIRRARARARDIAPLER